MKYSELWERVDRRSLADEEDVFLGDAALIASMLRDCEVEIPPQNRFFARVGEDVAARLWCRRAERMDLLADEPLLVMGTESLAYTGTYDFSHSSADWEAVISLGIAGLRDRIRDYAEQETDSGRLGFYRALLDVWDGALVFMANAAETARALGRDEMASSLSALTARPPHSLYEALQTMLVYYALQMSFDGTVLRTLGRLDTLLLPFAEQEDEATRAALLDDFLTEINSYRATANVPFAIAGCLPSGESAVTPFTYEILSSYLRVDTSEVKLHILTAKNTPSKLIELAFEGICAGKNSIVFLSDERIVEGLLRLGASREDAVRYHVVGCYECGARGELTCSCNARVSLPKALELALFGGRDPLSGLMIGLPSNGGFESFDDLFSEFLRQVRYLCECAMRATCLAEAQYPRIHAAPILTATYTSALDSARDLYCHGGAKYNNSSLNALGLGTAIDSLAAIRTLVYQEGRLSLAELSQLLIRNWEGEQELRLYALHKCPKYGMGDGEVDALAAKTVALLGETVVARPNARGGVFRLGLFSIDWRFAFGNKTIASANGRRCGETISQNTSASFGADRAGLTGHLASGAAIDTSLTPNGAIMDIDLHRSAAKPRMLAATLRSFFEMGGFGVHYNVLDAAILREAQAMPDRYPNLQVRLCGWNALFRSLPLHQQNELIDRARG